MSLGTPIEWTDATWNPLRVRVKPDAAAIATAKGYSSLIQIAEKMQGKVGHHCEHVSEECRYCYADRDNHRCRPGNGTGLPYDRRSRDLVEAFVDERILRQPLKWKEPKRIFVENQTDLFGEWFTDKMIDRLFAVSGMGDGIKRLNEPCCRHSFQILTKRPERLRAYVKSRDADFPSGATPIRIGENFDAAPGWVVCGIERAWFGVSVGNRAALPRIDILRDTPAAVRFVSFEPLLEDLGTLDLRGIHWAIVGGESGPKARPIQPMHPDWVRSIRNQCLKAGVSFFFKQWGEWRPRHAEDGENGERLNTPMIRLTLKGRNGQDLSNASDGGDVWMQRFGKKRAGRLLDGAEWSEFPESRS